MSFYHHALIHILTHRDSVYIYIYIFLFSSITCFNILLYYAIKDIRKDLLRRINMRELLRTHVRYQHYLCLSDAKSVAGDKFEILSQ